MPKHSPIRNNDANLIHNSSMSCNGGDDEDVDNFSLLAQAHTARESSIRGMSDWESNAGEGSTTELPRHGRPRNRDVEASGAADGDEAISLSASRHRGRMSDLRLFRWWSNLVSRVSRSASSLLNQHSPNLNDILEGNDENPLATVDEAHQVQPSIPEEDAAPCAPMGIESDENREAAVLREEVARLKKRIAQLEGLSADGQRRNGESLMANLDSWGAHIAPSAADASQFGAGNIPLISPVQMLQPDQISRYSRQLLLNDGFGVAGQKKLLSSSALVVGAGGIGSTVLLYLAAAGIGHITIVDYDRVEMSNLHRQVIHRDSGAPQNQDWPGLNKALSARQTVLGLNPTISCTALTMMIDAENSLRLVSSHDVVVDACDNPRTRYLLNDACILAGKPLVSGSAMGTEGQLTVYNYRIKATSDHIDVEGETPSTKSDSLSACYRCLYPNPVPAEGNKSCSDNGVLGPVPGLIGVLQAIEVIKVITGIGSIMHDRLMMYDSLQCTFLNIKKPPAKRNCAVCSPEATIRSMNDSENSLQNVRGPSACGVPSQLSGNLPPERQISCTQYNQIRKIGKPHVLLDVRVMRQFEMCSLDGSVNLPLERLEAELDRIGHLSRGELPVYCLCRRGIASVQATKIIQKSIEEKKHTGIHSVYNIEGGLNSWVRTVDQNFPQY